MNDLADECKKTTVKLEMLKHELSEEINVNSKIPFASFNKIGTTKIDENLNKEIKDYLNKVKKYYSDKNDKAVKNKDQWMNKFQETESGKAQYITLVNNNQNSKIEDLVKNVTSDLDPVVEDNGKLVATANPIYRDGPKDHFIRSHFFAPTKNVFGKSYSTFWVNIIVIWGMSLLLWITLFFDLLRKLLEIRIFKRKNIR